MKRERRLPTHDTQRNDVRQADRCHVIKKYKISVTRL